MESIEIQPLDACPAKIIIFDIQHHLEIHRYEFPTSVVGQGLFYLNDIVLQYQNGKARYAYMSDTLAYKLVVYDYLEDTSYAFTHPTMRNDPAYQNVTISNITLTGLITGINGIGMSPDFRYLYYSSVAGVGLQQIETSVLRNNRGNNEAFANAVRTIGRKASMGDGMAYGAKHNLYFSALALNSVHKWDIKNDLNLDKDFGSVQLITQSSLTSDDKMQWVDTLAIDDCGYLWFTTSRLNKFFSVDSIEHHEPNFFIWRIYVDDYNYMDSRYHGNNDTLGGGSVRYSLLLTALAFILSILMYK